MRNTSLACSTCGSYCNHSSDDQHAAGGVQGIIPRGYSRRCLLSSHMARSEDLSWCAQRPRQDCPRQPPHPHHHARHRRGHRQSKRPQRALLQVLHPPFPPRRRRTGFVNQGILAVGIALLQEWCMTSFWRRYDLCCITNEPLCVISLSTVGDF